MVVKPRRPPVPAAVWLSMCLKSVLIGLATEAAKKAAGLAVNDHLGYRRRARRLGPCWLRLAEIWRSLGLSMEPSQYTGIRRGATRRTSHLCARCQNAAVTDARAVDVRKLEIRRLTEATFNGCFRWRTTSASWPNGKPIDVDCRSEPRLWFDGISCRGQLVSVMPAYVCHFTRHVFVSRFDRSQTTSVCQKRVTDLSPGKSSPFPSPSCGAAADSGEGGGVARAGEWGPGSGWRRSPPFSNAFANPSSPPPVRDN